MFRACGFRVWCVGLRVQGQFPRACDVCVMFQSIVLSFEDSRLRVHRVGSRVHGSWFQIHRYGFPLQDSEFWVDG